MYQLERNYPKNKKSLQMKWVFEPQIELEKASIHLEQHSQKKDFE